MTARKAPLLNGLLAGADRAQLPALGEGIGEGMSRVYNAARLPGGRLAQPQPCPLCKRGPYTSTQTFKAHLDQWHFDLAVTVRSRICAEVKRDAVLAVEAHG